jgi:prepilin-type N-terminal cleavage/methylation domain-containing protein
MSARKGFTLIEIIVVLVILGVLATVALYNYNIMMMQGVAKAAQNNLITIYNAQQNYYFANGVYCTASCNTLANINTNLNLFITDNNFTYACAASGSSYTCTASIGSFTFVVTGQPTQLILPGGTGCAGGVAPPPCNPACSNAANPSYCPS